MSTDIKRQIEELNRRLPAELSEADHRRFAAAQSKAEGAYQAFGDSAPQWVNGETLTQYRQRLLGKFKQHSEQWKNVELSKLGDETALSVAETTIYADALNCAHDPANVPAGTLREVTETDFSGRKITRFFGDPEATWAPFKSPSQLVVGFIRNGAHVNDIFVSR